MIVRPSPEPCPAPVPALACAAGRVDAAALNILFALAAPPAPTGGNARATLRWIE
ncbi:hypothetical protein [Sphingomonas hengshuiensis]|uniref:hypothetical protein n=1 Tax=Sphingomonas hengshuiensis TaxID=1609977 RepID=UPI000AB06E5B|nr:hypothetical protein [Sphingomonas hengshuiensis]